MPGAYSAENSGSFDSAWSMSFHSCIGVNSREEEEVESGSRLSSEARLSSERKLMSFKVVARRKFCTAVTGVASLLNVDIKI